jgi:hypothetical protein
VLDFVGAKAFEAGGLDGRFDEVLIGGVQVEDTTGLEVSLFSKTHHDKTGAAGMRGGVRLQAHSKVYAKGDSELYQELRKVLGLDFSRRDR